MVRAAPVEVEGVCLATDVAGYTGFAEGLAPAALREFLNRYYEAVFGPVRAAGGLISDVVGDAVLALWPAGDARTRARACEAAAAIQAAVAALERPDGRKGMPTRIGIHAGTFVLGHVGALDHLEYRAVGDAVNTASRLEALCKPLGAAVLLSGPALPAGDAFPIRRLGRFRLRGRRAAVTVHELLPAGSPQLEHGHATAFMAAVAQLERGMLGPAAAAFASLAPRDPVAAAFSRLCAEERLRLTQGAIEVI